MYQDPPLHIQPLAKPFYLSHDEASVGVLLIHGFADSPYSMRTLAEHIQKLGYAVMALRLPGHGSRIEDLAKCTLEDWQESVAQAVGELSQKVKKVVLIGRSFGGVLALHETVVHPELVAGIVLLATPHTVRRAWMYAALVPWLKYLFPEVKKYWAKPEERVMRLEVGRYPDFSLHALQELFRSFRELRPEVLQHVKVPLLVIQGAKDTKGNPASAQYFMDSIPSTTKELLWLEDVDHEPEHLHHHSKVLAALQLFLANISHS